MILQMLDLQIDNAIKNATELYLRQRYGQKNQTNDHDRMIMCNEGVLTVPPETCYTFDTYFNAFSYEKWMHYTDIEDVSVRIEWKGIISLRIVAVFEECGAWQKRCMIEKELTAAEWSTECITLDAVQFSGVKMCYAEVENISSDDAQVRKIDYVTQTKPKREITFGIAICTYKREQDLNNNLNILKKNFVENANSPLYGRIQILVVDNGHTIPDSEDTAWTVVKNKNCGGAAGFSRGMLEYERKTDVSHVILMDDDIIIKPTAIEKTYVLLQYLKEEYNDYMIGGAMLRRDYPYIQHEAGGRYADGRIYSLHNGVDLRKDTNVFANEIIEQIDYNAWWYCCIPMQVIQRNGYALPLFIHQDDIEYGIRAGRKVMVMNGISVWHESFEKKRPSTNEYYDVRNILIVNSAMLAEYKRTKALKMVAIRMATNLFRYRYRDVALVAKAVDDFCKGPEWLMQTDGETLNQDVRKMGYQYNQKMSQPWEKSETVSYHEIVGGYDRSQRMDKKKTFLLNGYWFPTKTKKIVAIPAGASPHSFYRVKKAWVYDPDTEEGFYVQKSISRLLWTAGLTIKTLSKLTLKYSHLRKMYSEYYRRMCSKEFWTEYLGV